MKKIVAISDMHGYLPEIPECDLLLVGGDITPMWDHRLEFQADWLKTTFVDWLKKVPAEKIVGIAGNHDFILEENPDFGHSFPWHYLHDKTLVIPKWNLKIHGTPWTPRFGKWALMAPDSTLMEKWDKIPSDVDILLSHGPMYGYADIVSGYSLTKRGWEHSTRVGSQTLRNKIDYGMFPNMKLFICGHIHEAHGIYPVNDQLTVYNVSHMNDIYEPVNEPTVIEWKET